MAWSYVKGRWWIFVVATVPFIVIGSVFIWMDTAGDTSPDWDHPWYNSLLFLGILFIVSPIAQMWWTINKVRRGQ